MSSPIGVAVLGSTGSVGSQALEVIRAFPERFRVVGLCAGKNAGLLQEQIREFRPRLAVLADVEAAGRLREKLGRDLTCRVLHGSAGTIEVAGMPEADTVVAAVVGQAGLEGVCAAVRCGKRVALANKEALVMAGELVTGLARKHGASLVPVDSEHASLAQLLQPLDRGRVRRVVITASGGPLLGKTPEQLARVTAADALAHPNWEMGAKISIDSATMMNKGFEVIEARWLFDLHPERIGVLVHPESLVHALVELVDGSVLAHLGRPDMRLPIAWALGLADRLDLGERLSRFDRLDLAQAGRCTFLPADEPTWPALGLCRRALIACGGTPAALSVADEVVVGAFLEGRIPFPSIISILGQVLDRLEPMPAGTLDEVLTAGREGGRLAAELIADSC